MATYYVATDGNDSGNGSASSPWRTISRAMSSSLNPGDEVVVRPGIYREAVNITRDGSASAPITLRAEVEGEALIRAPSSAWNAVSINADYVVIDGFDISSAGGGDGIEGNNVHHVTISDNIVHDNGESGIQFNWSEFLVIEGNTTYGNASDGWFSGISVYQNRNITGDTTTPGYRTIVRNNVSYDNVTETGAHTDGNGIIIDDFQSTQTSGYPNYTYPTLVENNLVYGNGGKGIQVTWSDYVTVRNNTAYHNNVDDQNSGTWRGEISNAQSSNNTFINNIAIADPSINSNNTAIDNTSYGGYRNNGVTWTNNITFNGTVGAVSVKNDGGNPIPSAANGNLLGVDPQLANPAGGDFTPTANSPAVDGGVSVSGIWSEDVLGQTRVVGQIDIGAIESGSEPSTPPPPPPPPANTAPTATDDSGFKVTAGSGMTIQATSLLANDADADGDALEIVAVSGALGGTVQLNAAGNIVFSAASTAGNGGFTYTVSDPDGATDTAYVAVTVDPVPTTPTDPTPTDPTPTDPVDDTNAAPDARRDTGLTATRGETTIIDADRLLANDVDPDGDPLSIVRVRTSSGNGTVSLTADGDISFKVAPDAGGQATLVYTISDDGGLTDRARAIVNIEEPTATTPTTPPVESDETVSILADNGRPSTLAHSDPNGVELGMEFVVEADGVIEALRYYEGRLNGTVHTGHLWTSSGDLIADVTFGAADARGWQIAALDTPIAVEAGETYIVSYYVPAGDGYAVTPLGFDDPIDAGPISTGESAGLFAYGPEGSFPTESYNDNNYWVDVLFNPI
ncbi:DUF4082 domain-containing protein [Acuticoccus kandeliae]|uniref:DUF4082 domain-containing protein n=1 Tax=Acuticoccus kandeliae TaxID=2073160 RepID=UPI000D3E115C|nr:DUF4082 domain-containing protein [Acuticoccus kandeliae]